MKNEQKWYYDRNFDKCIEFKFYGNGGNLNNFETENLCLSTCKKISTQIKFKDNIESLDQDPLITSLSMSILINDKMSPEFSILAFYVENGEVIPDSVIIPVRKCLKNKVLILFLI